MKNLQRLIDILTKINKTSSVKFFQSLPSGFWSIVTNKEVFCANPDDNYDSYQISGATKCRLYDNGWVSTYKEGNYYLSGKGLSQEVQEIKFSRFPMIDPYRNRFLEESKSIGFFNLKDSCGNLIKSNIVDCEFGSANYVLFFSEYTQVLGNDDKVIFEILKKVYDAEIFKYCVSFKVKEIPEVWELYSLDGQRKISEEDQVSKIKFLKNFSHDSPLISSIATKSHGENGWCIYDLNTMEKLEYFKCNDFELYENGYTSFQYYPNEKFKIFNSNEETITSTHGVSILSNGWVHTKELTLCNEEGTVLLSNVRSLCESKIGLFLLIENHVYVIDLNTEYESYKDYLIKALDKCESGIEQTYLINYAYIVKNIINKPYSLETAKRQISSILS